MNFKKIRLFYSLLLVIAISVASSQAVPQFVPEFYEGYVYLEGQPAPEGTLITLKVSDTQEVVGEVTTLGNDGYYMLIVVFDNDQNPEDEGAENGEALTWYVNQKKATLPKAGVDVAESGKENRNFNILLFAENAGSESIITGIKPSLKETKQISPFLYLVVGIILGIVLSRIRK